MSTTIDEKVVEMRFDNQKFESNVKTTLSTLDKLKAKLDFKKTADSFDSITKASKNVDISPLSAGAEVVKAKFSAMEVVAVTALANITNSAVNAGKRIVKSLTIDPVTTGFQEYELKMNSVQTIMASTGRSIEEVNKYLNELNEYSDKTIYSFSDMTSNIGKFTNAGVSLDDAVLAMKGISNEAAVSGANANEASRAMYNLAQSISMGYVQLIDWKSIENANMATIEFKNQLANTAVELGVVKKSTKGYTTATGRSYTIQQLFKDGLQEQWLTTDVLIKTLRDYADETTEIGKKAYESATKVKTFTMLLDTLKEAAQSGWAQTWELIIGDLEEAKVLWTEASDFFGEIIGTAAKSRNDLLAGALNSKWDQFSAKFEEAGLSVDVYGEKLEEVAKRHNISLSEMIEKEGSLSQVISKGLIKKDILREALDEIVRSNEEVSSSTTTVVNKLESFQTAINGIISGKFGTGADRVKALTDAGYDAAATQSLLNYIWNRNGQTWSNTTITLEELTSVVSDLTDAEIESIGVTKEQKDALIKLATEASETGESMYDLLESMEKPSGRELLIDTIRNSGKAVVKILRSVKSAWSSVMGSFKSSQLYNIISAIHKFSKELIVSDQTATRIQKTFEGLFSVLKLVGKVAYEIFSNGFMIFYLGDASITLIIHSIFVFARIPVYFNLD